MVGLVGVQRWRGGAPPKGHPVASTEREDAAAGEARLLQAGRAGDRAALERLLVPYERPLFALCRGILGHAEDAEDAVQETFLRALRALPAFRGEAAVRSWLYRIAVNVCLDRKRSHHATEPWDDEQTSGASHPSPERIALHHLRLTEALGALQPRQRVVLLLKELEGWSAAEIAQTVGWNEKKVYNELHRARLALAAWRRRDAGEGDER
jgi:RNA polymerase sigma-70 factor (ECF subfamily)